MADDLLLVPKSWDFQYRLDRIAVLVLNLEVPIPTLCLVYLFGLFLAGHGQGQMQIFRAQFGMNEGERRRIGIALLLLYKTAQVGETGAPSRSMGKIPSIPLVLFTTPAVCDLALGAVHRTIKGWKIILFSMLIPPVIFYL